MNVLQLLMGCLGFFQIELLLNPQHLASADPASISWRRHIQMGLDRLGYAYVRCPDVPGHLWFPYPTISRHACLMLFAFHSSPRISQATRCLWHFLWLWSWPPVGDGVSSQWRTGWEDHHHIETGWPTWMEVVEIWVQQFCRTNVPARSCYIKRAGPKNVFKGTTNQLHTEPSISLALHQKKCFLWSVHRLNPFCSVKSC